MTRKNVHRRLRQWGLFVYTYLSLDHYFRVEDTNRVLCRRTTAVQYPYKEENKNTEETTEETELKPVRHGIDQGSGPRKEGYSCLQSDREEGQGRAGGGT